ncbi:unnamed protein product [Pneumocystis jirovecii]|uniref:Telomere-associated protein Rif1 N-terminal domain-containing protein n=1 Tax=Pneumocystis jirovecii TaxID=42068 RepID=L0PD66_PNEJI|nr:unnamed protein product [Pneumocystis jirovecii]
MTSLFDVEKVKSWKDDRLADNLSIEPSEIPRIEPKWIRNNISIIRSAIEIILISTVLPTDFKLSVWRNFNKSVNFAAMDAVTKICGLLKSFWFLSPNQNLFIKKTENDLNEHVNLFSQLVSISFEIISYMYFMNKSCIIENEDLILAQATGSRNLSCQQNLYTPIAFIFRLFFNPFPRASINETYFKAIFDIISNIGLLQPKDSDKIDLLVECLSVFGCTKDHNLQIQIWKLFSEAVKKFFFESNRSLHVSSIDIEDTIKQRNGIFKILKWGHRISKNREVDCLLNWEMLFDVFYQKFEAIIGITGAGYKIIEPLAESLLQESPEVNKNIYNICTVITKKVKFPLNNSTMNLSEPNLKATKIPKKTISYENFNMLISNLLALSYKHNPDKSIISFIQGVSNYIKIIPIYEITQSLQCIQGGLSLWILDEKEIIKKCSKAILNIVIKELWFSVLSKLESLNSYESSLLCSLSLLLESGLRSKNHSVVLSTVEMWNKTFGEQTMLDYPPEIVKVMEFLSKTLKILLPSFPISLDNDNPSTLCIPLDPILSSDNENIEYQEFPSTSSNKLEVIQNTTNQTSHETNMPSSLIKTHNKKITTPIEPSMMTRRMSAKLAQSVQKKASQDILNSDFMKNTRKEENKISKSYSHDNNIQEMDPLKTGTSEKLTLENKNNNFLSSMKKDTPKNTKLKNNKTLENSITKSEKIISLGKRKHDSEPVDDSLLDDSPLLKRLRPRRSTDNHRKTLSGSLETHSYTKNCHSSYIDASFSTTPTIQSKSTDLFIHLEQLLPQMEHTIPQMTHQSLLKLESILLRLQNTIFKTREKFIMNI